jgi:hypothetical protein
MPIYGKNELFCNRRDRMPLDEFAEMEPVLVSVSSTDGALQASACIHHHLMSVQPSVHVLRA